MSFRADSPGSDSFDDPVRPSLDGDGFPAAKGGHEGTVDHLAQAGHDSSGVGDKIYQKSLVFSVFVS